MPNDVVIPADLDPVSPESVALIDDATQVFQPSMARGNAQRVSFGDPRWRITRRYQGVRAQDKARLMNVFNEARGRFATVRTSPGYVQRGSFPSQELLTNPFFSLGSVNGAGQFIPTAWNSESPFAVTAKDNVLRATLALSIAGAYAFIPDALSGVTQYGTYASRYFIQLGKDISVNAQRVDDYGVMPKLSSALKSMNTDIIVPRTTSTRPAIALFMTNPLPGPGVYAECPYASFARAPLVDTGANLIPFSDTFSDASWTKVRCSIGVNVVAGPDGTTTADSLIEDNSAGLQHFIQTANLAVTSTAQEITTTAYVKANTRTWCALSIVEFTGPSQADAYLNLATGALGTVSSGANMQNARASVTAIGNGWYRFSLTAYKTNAATAIQPHLYLATANGITAYDGNGVSGIYIWRMGITPGPASSVPNQTTGVASTGTIYTNSVSAKGFPASAAGSLLAGDFIEINGELKMVTAPVHSDANGNATINFRPALVGAPADNDPIIVCNPMGRFLATNIKWDAQWGIQLDLSVQLDELYEP